MTDTSLPLQAPDGASDGLSDHLHEVPSKTTPNLVWREKPTPSHPDIREELYNVVQHAELGHYDKPWDAVDQILALFIHQLDSLLEQAISVDVPNDDTQTMDTIKAIPVSALEQMKESLK